jgi:Taurine catabolism dioxygenase TauD, TfdA family/Gamma-butyrobetaine hydroxylase-like, N-terminal
METRFELYHAPRGPMGMNRYTVESLHVVPSAVQICWADGHRSLYHHIWLRDNCECDRCGYHGDRKQSPLDLPDEINPVIAEAGPSELTVTWTNGGHLSRFNLRWLRDHCYSDTERARRHPKKSLWDSSLRELPTADYQMTLTGDAERFKLFSSVREYGFVLLKNVGVLHDEIERLGRAIGYFRETNYGRFFDFRVNPGSEILTDIPELKPHTDEIFRHVPTGVNMFHCIEPNRDGGGVTTLVDSFTIAAQLRAQDPDAFDLLSRMPIQHERRIDGQFIRSHNPVFTVNFEGRVTEVRLNERTMSTLSLPEELMEATYCALRKTFRIAYDPVNAIRHCLVAGEALVFDNLRVLHGRTGFRGERFLREAHVMRDEFFAKLEALEQSGPYIAN